MEKNLKNKIKIIRIIMIFVICYLFFVLTFPFLVRLRGKDKYDDYRKIVYTESLNREVKNGNMHKILKYYRKLGEINIYQKNYDIAYEDLKKVLEIGEKELLKNKSLSKKMFLNFYTLGDGYEKKGEKDKALKNYKIAKDINVKYLNSYKKYLLFIDEEILKIENKG